MKKVRWIKEPMTVERLSKILGKSVYEVSFGRIYVGDDEYGAVHRDGVEISCDDTVDEYDMETLDDLLSMTREGQEQRSLHRELIELKARIEKLEGQDDGLRR